ncbi:MAG: nucleotidyltransferase domain-containing protein [Methylomonas sp.]|nr:nucleotidyltransferase domain-containing protein [Methylomonas sp.]
MPNEALAERCGLSVKTIAVLQKIFSNYKEVEQVVLYGSRAKGTQRKGSDIDLTLLGDKLDYRMLTRIETEIDDLLLPYTVDLSLFAQIDNPDLIDHIRRVGLIFYPAT